MKAWVLSTFVLAAGLGVTPAAAPSERQTGPPAVAQALASVAVPCETDIDPFPPSPDPVPYADTSPQVIVTGYMGASMAAEGYAALGGQRMTTQGTTGVAVLPNVGIGHMNDDHYFFCGAWRSPYWAPFFQPQLGGEQAVWLFAATTDDEWRFGGATAIRPRLEQLIARIRMFTDAPIYASAPPNMTSSPTCKTLTPTANAATLSAINALVANGTLAGSLVLPPLAAAQKLNRCHPNEAGKALWGHALLSFFGAGVPPPAISIGDVTAVEGDAGTSDATFELTLDRPAQDSVSVDFATAEGTATGSADYTAASGTVSLAPGQTSALITVPVHGDTLDEDDETFTVVLSGAQGGADLARSTGQGTIGDDDASPGIAIGDVSVVEGDAGTSDATFELTLDAPSGRTVSVDFATANGTATAPADYTASSGTLSLAPGQTSAPITVLVHGDTQQQGDETFAVTVTTQGAQVDDGTGLATIVEDDPVIPPVANADSASTTVNNAVSINVLANDTDVDGVLIPSTVTVTTPPAHGVATVNTIGGTITFTPASGFAGSDSFTYTVSDDDGATSSAAAVSVTVNAPPSSDRFPSSFTIEIGALGGGTAASLTADDNTCLVVRTKVGTSISWYATFTGIGNDIRTI